MPIVLRVGVDAPALSDRLAMGAEFGATAIDLAGLNGRAIDEWTLRQARDAGAAIADQGMAVALVTSRFGEGPVPRGIDRERMLDRLKRAAEFACEWACGTIAVRSFDSMRSSRSNTEVLRSLLIDIQPVLQDFGVAAAVMAEPGSNLPQVSVAAPILDDPHLLRLQLVADSQTFRRGPDEALTAWLDDVESVRDHVAMLRLSDRDAQNRACFPGEGSTPLAEILDAAAQRRWEFAVAMRAGLHARTLPDRVKERFRPYLHGDPFEAGYRAQMAWLYETFGAADERVVYSGA